MNGHVYDFMPSARSNQFIETTRELTIYVGCKYLEHTAELVQAVIDAKAIQIKRWEFAEKEYQAKLKTYRDFRAGLYSTVLGQCTDVYIQNSRQERNSGQQARMGSSC
jgi:hypothetical protein